MVSRVRIVQLKIADSLLFVNLCQRNELFELLRMGIMTNN